MIDKPRYCAISELEKMAKEATPGPWGDVEAWAYIAVANPETILKLIAVVKAAINATKDGTMPEGYTFKKEDADQYFELELAVVQLELSSSK